MSNTVIIKPEFRTNPLSTIPGGSIVGIVWNDDPHRKMFLYNNIKNTDRYIQTIIESNSTRQIDSIYIDGILIWQFV